MKTPRLGLALLSLLLCPRLMHFTTPLGQNCRNGSYEISVLMMKNSAFPESPDNLRKAVEQGVEIVRKRLIDDGKNMLTESSSSLLQPLGSKGC